MNYRVLGVEYLTVSDSLPNQAHLHEDLGTEVRLRHFKLIIEYRWWERTTFTAR